MSLQLRPAISALCTLALVACATASPGAAGDPSVDLSATEPPRWNGVITGVRDSGIHGAADLTVGQQPRETRVLVSIAGAPANSALAWFVLTGPCSESGSVFGPASAYGTLVARADGHAESLATLPLAPPAQPAAGRLHVAVLRSAADPTSVVACGELALQTR
jgi:hypothetical protein